MGAIMNKLRLTCLCLIALSFLYSSNVHAGPPAQSPSELVTTSPDATFQKIVEKLFNNNCIILAVDRQLGLITFRTQAEDNSNSARRHVNILEGTILVNAETSSATRIRVKLTLGWQESRSDYTFQTGAQKEADAGWYKFVFDMLGFSTQPPAK
jgi:hypothetical protein